MPWQVTHTKLTVWFLSVFYLSIFISKYYSWLNFFFSHNTYFPFPFHFPAPSKFIFPDFLHCPRSDLTLLKYESHNIILSYIILQHIRPNRIALSHTYSNFAKGENMISILTNLIQSYSIISYPSSIFHSIPTHLNPFHSILSDLSSVRNVS